MMRPTDADALIERWCKDCTHGTQEDCKTDPGCVFVELVVAAPTVDAQPVMHGRWEAGYLIHKYGCSCCGARQDMISPYCPNCGAKMDQEVAT